MAAFNGTLNQNKIFAALYNMIISQQVFADNIHSTKSTLVDRARVDGTLYGDTKLYYSSDVLKSVPWGNDAEAANLLQLHRPKAPNVQAITLDVFRQISLTVDHYLSKQAFATENTFSQFNSVMLGWIRDTKRVYDSTTYNVFIGVTESAIGKQKQTIDPSTAIGSATGEAAARIEAAVIAEEIAKLLVELTDVNRNYNDYGNLRSSLVSDLVFVWNADLVARIQKRDLPTIYHKEIVDKLGEHTLPSRYFGEVNKATLTTSTAGTRSLIEQDITLAGTETVVEPVAVTTALGVQKVLAAGAKPTAGDIAHVFPGDALPTGTALVASGAITVPTYNVDDTILFKVYHKNSAPYMSAFEVGTSFFNPKSLTENHYLTFGHNTLEYIKNYPFITVRLAAASSSSD